MKKILIALCAVSLAGCSAVEDVRNGVLNTKQNMEEAVRPNTSTEVRQFGENDIYVFTGPETLADNEYIKIELNSIVKDEFDWYYLNLTYVNKMDHEITVTMDSLSVNDLYWAAFGYDDVKKNSSYKLTLTAFPPKEEGLHEIDNLRMYFCIDDDQYRNLCSLNGTLYLNGEENAVSDLYEIQESDRIIMDNEVVTLVDMGSLIYEEPWLYKPLYAFNKSEDTINLSFRHMVINGVEADLFDYATLAPKSGAWFYLKLFDTELEEYGLAVDEVSSLQSEITLRDSAYEVLLIETADLQ